jgi:hypothetical protein
LVNGTVEHATREITKIRKINFFIVAIFMNTFGWAKSKDVPRIKGLKEKHESV